MDPRYSSRRANTNNKPKNTRLHGIKYGRLTAIIFVGSLTYLFAAPPLQASMANLSVKPVPSNLKTSSQITDIINTHPGDKIGVALEDVSSGQALTYGSTDDFDAASTGKVIMAAACLSSAEHGTFAITPQTTYQIRTMINQSSNESWHALTDTLGYPALQAFSQSHGIRYETPGNKISAVMMAHTMAKLYNNELTTPEHTQQILSYMQNTIDDSLIPAAVPGNLTVYHKYGDADDNLHDAAIITNSTRTYALVIYTQSQSNYDERVALIHQLTSAALQQMQF